MSDYNIIGDVAGNFNTLKKLLGKMPGNNTVVCLGDPNDRGPRSKQVIQYFMKKGILIQSNHAHMMTESYVAHKDIDRPYYYDPGTWTLINGGYKTLDSYSEKFGELSEIIPEEDIEFLLSCPMYIETDKFLMTHAPLHPSLTLKDACDLGKGFARNVWDQKSDFSLLWNRVVPKRPHPDLKGKINVFGHNANTRPTVYSVNHSSGIRLHGEEFTEYVLDSGNKVFGICLDTSLAKILTGLDTKTMRLYVQDYID